MPATPTPTPSPKSVTILFVCLGNICRSPLAENVSRALARDAGVADRLEIDSAGTSGWHIGEPPDARAAEEARRRGVELEGSSRRLDADDLDRFDYIIVMDEQNLSDVRALATLAPTSAEIRMLREFDPEADGPTDVPDPYFGGERGFADVHDIVERSCRGLLEHVREVHGF
ncbi:MAG: low molecular weight protein-tyrosine-phosphatase [Longimicrobiales bacterium]